MKRNTLSPQAGFTKVSLRSHAPRGNASMRRSASQRPLWPGLPPLWPGLLTGPPAVTEGLRAWQAEETCGQRQWPGQETGPQRGRRKAFSRPNLQPYQNRRTHPLTTRIGNTLVWQGHPEEIYSWSVRWLQSQRKLSPKHEDQVVALEAHLKRMKELHKTVTELARELVPRYKEDEAEWYRLEAEIWLAEAKSANAK